MVAGDPAGIGVSVLFVVMAGEDCAIAGSENNTSDRVVNRNRSGIFARGWIHFFIRDTQLIIFSG